ncbi:MAG: VanW family protein, partial [Candidatus Fimadaptatus sp.]
RPAAARARREERDEDWEEQDAPERPRNRFMAWLESMRIVEEVPQDERPRRRAREDGADHEDERPRRRAPEERERRDVRSRRRPPEPDYEDEDDGREDGGRRSPVPVPTGRQRRGEIAEYTEDYADDAARDAEDAAQGTEPVGRAEAAHEEAPAAHSEEAHEEAPIAHAETAQPMEPAAQEGEYVARTGVAREAEPADAIESASLDDIGDEPVPRRRRARREAAQPVSAPQEAEAPAQAEDAAPAGDADAATAVPEESAAPAEDDSLEQRYISASLEGKRRILLDHWQEAFAQKLVIPAKEDKLRAITGMVESILDACPDEYALGERWEKIEELLERYSSAVVAEYGYRSLLASVQAEEQQRMYGRPDDSAPRGEPQTPRLATSRAPVAEPDAVEAEPQPDEPETAEEYADEPAGDEPEDWDTPEADQGRSARRGYGSEFDYEPERRRGALGRLMDRVKERGARGGAEDGGHAGRESRMGRIRQLFRRGDVLDYSSDEPEEPLDDFDTDQQHERSDADNEITVTYDDEPGERADYSTARAHSRDAGDYRAQGDDYAVERSYGPSRSRDAYSRDAGDYRDAQGDDYAVERSYEPPRSRETYSRDAGDYRDAQGEDYAVERSYEPSRSREAYSRDAGDYHAQGDDYAVERSYVPSRSRDDSPWRRPEPAPELSVYDENSEDYSADRPDYSQDYADDEARPDYGSRYVRANYAETGYARPGSYERGYVRADAVNRPLQRDYGERGYRTRPQGGNEEQTGEDSDDRWRRCSPTRDDGDGMGASQEGTDDRGRAGAAGRGLMGLLGRMVFTAALADSGDEAREGAGVRGLRARLGRKVFASALAASADEAGDSGNDCKRGVRGLMSRRSCASALAASDAEAGDAGDSGTRGLLDSSVFDSVLADSNKGAHGVAGNGGKCSRLGCKAFASDFAASADEAGDASDSGTRGLRGLLSRKVFASALASSADEAGDAGNSGTRGLLDSSVFDAVLSDSNNEANGVAGNGGTRGLLSRKVFASAIAASDAETGDAGNDCMRGLLGLPDSSVFDAVPADSNNEANAVAGNDGVRGSGAGSGKRGLLSRLVFTSAFADSEDESQRGAPDGDDYDSRQSAIRRRGVRPGARMERGARGYLRMAGTLALLAVLGAGACAGRVVYEVLRYDGAFYQGLYLDGVELAGMTLEEAEGAVNALNAARVEAVHLSVTYAGESYDIDSAGLGVSLDTRSRLEEMWSVGREGGIAARYAQLERAREQGVHEQTSLSYSEAALDGFLGGIKEAVDREPRDAVIKFSPNAENKFAISESASGREVDLTALKADARAALAGGSFAVELAPKRLEPAFSTADARACTGRLVRYGTNISSSNSSRTANIKLALSFYHGLRVEPGQQVDFNKLVGARTEARGFKPAPEYSNGEIVDGIGGGVCQASTTLYGALLRVGVRIDERYNHSMTVGYVPRSQDAAVVYPGKTLSFTNTTGYPLFFTTSVTADRATVTIYGYDVYPGRTVSIESEILSVDAAKVNTYADPGYQYTTEPGQIVTVTTPSDGVTSRAYRVLTDDATGREVSRELLSKDTYRRRDGVRYRGGE